MPTFAVNFLLFFLPLVVFPIGVSPFEIPKVLAAEIILELFIVWSFLKYFVFEKNNLRIHFLLFSFFALSIFQLLTNQIGLILLGGEYRMQGVFLYWHLFLFSFLLAKDQYKLTFLLAIIGFFGIFLTMFLIDPGENLRLIGTVGEPNALAATLVFLWPVLVSLKNNRIFTVIILFFSFTGILFTGSVSTLIAFLIQLFFLALVKIKKIPLKINLVICLLLLLSSWALPFVDRAENWDRRSEIWQNAFEAGLQKPILGNGFGIQELVLKRVAQERRSVSQYAKIDSAHNIFLDWFLQGGIVALVILLSLMFRTLMVLLKEKNFWEIAAFLGLLTSLSFNPASVISLVALFWLFRHAFYVKNS